MTRRPRRNHGLAFKAKVALDPGFRGGTRPHSPPGGRPPDQACLDQPTPIPAAA